jgi:hypothetical protein
MIAETLANVTISTAQSDHFHEHGFVKLPGLLNLREVRRTARGDGACALDVRLEPKRLQRHRSG